MALSIYRYKRVPDAENLYTWDEISYDWCTTGSFLPQDKPGDYVSPGIGESITFSVSDFIDQYYPGEDQGDGTYIYRVTSSFRALDESLDDSWHGSLLWFRLDEEHAVTGTAAPSFSDVVSASSFASAIDWAVEQGIATGYSDRAFRPSNTCTVSHILTFLWRAAGSSGESAAAWAESQGLTASGANLSVPCTRAAAVTYMRKAAGNPESAKTTTFSDVSARADYAKAVSWAVEQGITTGTNATTFAPDKTCTQGHIVTFLYRANAELKNQPPRHIRRGGKFSLKPFQRAGGVQGQHTRQRMQG